MGGSQEGRGQGGKGQWDGGLEPAAAAAARPGRWRQCCHPGSCVKRRSSGASECSSTPKLEPGKLQVIAVAGVVQLPGWDARSWWRGRGCQLPGTQPTSQQADSRQSAASPAHRHQPPAVSRTARQQTSVSQPRPGRAGGGRLGHARCRACSPGFCPGHRWPCRRRRRGRPGHPHSWVMDAFVHSVQLGAFEFKSSAGGRLRGGGGKRPAGSADHSPC